MNPKRAPHRRRGRTRLATAALIVIGALLVLAVSVASQPTPTLMMLRRALLTLRGIEHGSVTVDGQTLAWCAVGAGRPLLLQHGLRGEATVMIPLAEELAQRGFRVVMLDLPGHGRSPQPTVALDLERAGRLLLDAADQLGLGDRPVIVGHSLGGWVLAWQALASPERCGPLVMISSPGYRFEAPPLDVLLPGTVAQGRKALPYMFADPPWVPAPALWLAVHRDRRVPLQMLHSALSGDYLLEGLLPSLERPPLVIFGAEDRVVPPAVGQAMVHDAPGSTYVEIPAAGHLVVYEQPAAVADAIDRYLRQSQPAKTAPSNGSS